LEAFGLASLRDLPDLERLKAEGLLQTGQENADLDSALLLGKRRRIPWRATTLFDAKNSAHATWPRLGSRVRIPSPAPNFLKEINFLERPFGAVFCFPASLSKIGEAEGKQWGEDRSGRAATFGICQASIVPSRVTPGNGARSPDNLPSRWLGMLPEMTVAFSIRSPGCFLSFFAKDTDQIIQLVHQGSPSA
jgi:hypothetical protein